MQKTIYTIFTFLFTILALNGCCGPSDYSFANITLSDSRDEDTFKITDPKTTFASDTAIIYGQASFTNPNEGDTTYILINYSHINNGEPVIVDSMTKTTQYGGLMIFEGKRPGFSWPTGQYQIDIIINNITYASAEYTVVPPGEVVSGEKSGWISDTQTSKTVDSSHNPTSPTSTFTSNTEEIHLTIDATSQMPKNTKVKVDWVYLDQKQNIISQEQTLSTNQSTHFTLDQTSNRNFLLSNGDWPSGSYKADIYLDNTFIKQVQFKVN